MPEYIILDPADSIAAGAVGEPGNRAFYIQAAKEGHLYTVLVEKEQVRMLAEQALTFLDRIAEEIPEDEIPAEPALLSEPTEPLFRAQLLGIGFDVSRSMVMLELRESANPAALLAELDDEGAFTDSPSEDQASLFGDEFKALMEANSLFLDGAADAEMEHGEGAEMDPGSVVRVFVTRAQVRAMASRGTTAVAAGRPICRLCERPIDPDGHRCPRMN